MLTARHDLAQLAWPLAAVLGACTLSHQVGVHPTRVIEDDGGPARGVPLDAGRVGLDASFPVDDAGSGAPISCSAEDAMEASCPSAVCDGLDSWHWNGDSCFRIDCGTCVGADCIHTPSWLSETACEAAHSHCQPAICRATGGDWLWWAEECHDYLCGHAQPAECFVGHAVCDCGAGRRFDDGVGCVDEPTCPPPLRTTRDALCTSTGGTWGGFCCDTICGELCPDPCVSDACNCGPGRIFDAMRGCIESARCHDRNAGETCEGTARCATGTICCQACGGAGCFGPHTCIAPVCDTNPFTDECGNDSRAP